MSTTTTQDASSTPTGKGNVRSQSVLQSLAKWFWSAWTINNSETHGSQIESFDAVDNIYLFTLVTDGDSKQAPAKHEQPQAKNGGEEMTCRACQSRGVVCDGRRPQCSHCCHEQLLCVYVSPVRKTWRKTKASRAALESVPIWTTTKWHHSLKVSLRFGFWVSSGFRPLFISGFPDIPVY